MVIDPSNYRIAVQLADAAAKQAEATAQNAEREAERRRKLNDLAVTAEQRQTYDTGAVATQAQIRAGSGQRRAGADQPRAHADPLSGQRLGDNLLARLGDYARVGETTISVVDAESLWVDGYFEETKLGAIREGDPAKVKLMCYSQIIHGRVGSIRRGINVPMRNPTSKASRRLTRSSLGCAWRSACRCASISIGCPRMYDLSPA